MINAKNLQQLKSLVFGLTALFFLVFICGILDLGATPLLVIVLLYSVLSVSLIDLIFKSKVIGKLKSFLLLTGISAIVFSLGISYGILGVMGYYSINDIIYLFSVIASWVGFITGVIGSLILLNKSGKKKGTSTEN